MTERHERRVARTAAATERAGLAALLVTPSPDLRYLTGYGPPPLERLTLLAIVPGRNATMLVPELERPLALASPMGERLEVLAWNDGQDPYAEAARLIPERGRVAVTDQTWGVHLLQLQARRPGASFEPASPVLAPIRAVKDAEEIELLARAGRAADEALRSLLASGRLEGRREEEVAADLGRLLVETGHERAGFTIVGSGPNGASPHHEAGGRSIRAGDPVVMDFGGPLGGYFSDTARTVCVGYVPDGFEEIYELVREAQEAAVRAVAPGVPAEEVDLAAREVIEAGGYGDRFVHRTGHGIGLEAHEEPYLVRGSTDPLLPGMAFSVEPGIYLEGRFGVRIEDIVVVTDDGARRLNNSPRELRTIP
jgi:Xaa-Pro aminopeptidase